MGEEVVAVALEIVADEIGVIAVGDEADALGQERVFDLDLFQSDRALLAGDLGKAGDLVDQLALASCAACVKANFAPSGTPCKIEESGKRIRVAAKDPPKMTMKACSLTNMCRSPPIRITSADDAGAAQQTQTGGNIHDLTPPNAREMQHKRLCAAATEDPRLALLRGGKG